MSIIDDTLNQLGRPANAPDGVPVGGRPAPEVLFTGEEKRSGRLPRSLMLGGILLCASVAAWLVVEGTSAGLPLQPAEPSRAAAPSLPAVASGPVAAAVPVAEPVSPPAAEPEPQAGAVPPAVAPASPAPAGSAPADPSAAPTAVAATALPPSALPGAAPVAEQASPLPAAPAPKRIPAGLQKGRELLGAGQPEEALAAWRAGLQAMNPRQRLEMFGSYKDIEGAIALAGRLEDLDGVFIIDQEQRGQKLWRVGLLSSPAHREGDLEIAAARLGRNNFSSSTPALLLKTASKPAALPLPAETPVARVEVVRPPNAPKALPPLPAGMANFDELAARLVSDLEQYRYREATQTALDLRTHFPQKTETWLWSGKAELGLGNFREAEAHLRRATDMAPHLAEAWLLRAIAAQEQGQDPQALSMLSEARRLRPDDPDILFNIAYSAARLGDMDKARQSYRIFLDKTVRQPRFDAQRRHAEQWLAQGL